jgi:predicted nucleic acid-binding protein
MKVVLDTNVLLVSIPKKSKYRAIFDALIDGHFNAVISNDILSEYVEI